MGPKVRQVLGDSEIIKSYIEMQNQSASQALSEVEDCNFQNIPENAKYFLATWPNRKPDGNFLTASFVLNFLSSHCAKLVREAVNSVKDLDALRHNKLDFRMQENAVADMLIDRGEGTGVPDKWTYYVANSEAKIAARLPVEDIPRILTRKKEIIYGHSFELPVTELEDNVLYVPAIHNFIFTDMFVVDHKSKTLFFFQVSALVPSKHSHSVAKLNKLLASLGMQQGGRGEDYKVVYIYCADAAESGALEGYHFDEPNDPIIQLRVTCFLARVEYYPKLTQITAAPQLSVAHLKAECKRLGLKVKSKAGKTHFVKSDYKDALKL